MSLAMTKNGSQGVCQRLDMEEEIGFGVERKESEIGREGRRGRGGENTGC